MIDGRNHQILLGKYYIKLMGIITDCIGKGQHITYLLGM